MQLDEDIRREITALCEEGDQHGEDGAFAEAAQCFEEAFDLLPAPQSQWEETTLILAALGEANIFMGDFECARHYLTEALHCPGGLGNPFIHMRKGQAHFELGEMDEAADDFIQTAMRAGVEIFQDEDPKYTAFLEDRLKDLRTG